MRNSYFLITRNALQYYPAEAILIKSAVYQDTALLYMLEDVMGCVYGLSKEVCGGNMFDRATE